MAAHPSSQVVRQTRDLWSSLPAFRLSLSDERMVTQLDASLNTVLQPATITQIPRSQLLVQPVDWNTLTYMSKPILLWRPKPTATSDDACTAILKYTLPAPPPSPPYEAASLQHDSRLRYVPPLAYFCIRRLLQFPDQVHVIGPARIRYRPSDSPQAYDLLRALIPSYSRTTNGVRLNLAEVDPRLWALIVQLYSNLPEELRVYTIPLSDPHVPLLQQIPQTPDFALVTVLELPSCSELNDETIVELRFLHNLCALDASRTTLSALGLRRLSKTLAFADSETAAPEIVPVERTRIGPWGLRILRLRDCFYMRGDGLISTLMMFPLLSAVDLRGTPFLVHSTGHFGVAEGPELYHPTPLTESLSYLSRMAPSAIFSHREPFILKINSLQYQEDARRARAGAAYVTDTSLWNTRTGVPSEPSLSTKRQNREFHEDVFGADLSDTFYDTERWGSCAEGLSDDEEHRAFTDQDNWDVEEEEGGDEESDLDEIDDDEYDSADESDDTTALALATEETTSHARHLAAQRFYHTTIAHSPIGVAVRNSHPDSNATHATRVSTFIRDPSMLYRPPPPWSLLGTLCAQTEDPKAKRRRTEISTLDAEVQKTDKVQNSKGGAESVKTLVGMVQRRLARETAPSQPQATFVPTSTNPFLRKRRGASETDETEGNGVPLETHDRDVGPVLHPGHSRQEEKQRYHRATSFEASKQLSKPRPFKSSTDLKVPQLPPSWTSRKAKEAHDARNSSTRIIRPFSSNRASVPTLMQKQSDDSKLRTKDHAGRGSRLHDAQIAAKGSKDLGTNRQFDWKG
ncbi:hypothetical protein CERSUDRAFT_123138 [Gelatoporia subvermispora B]|uniref:Uncharacterized protein n=1 Tax=Ceriporiopsis subvermispora (strain B) TaxID=914234 RepID=M2QNC9_CERS8|nr:hypothetical protein CERSUDRAFT_123138 [Gelatoporia subvermispora B]